MSPAIEDSSSKPITLIEIAAGIDFHLKRFAATPEISHEGKRTKFWNAGAYQTGRYVAVRYISYQGSHCLSKKTAQNYLDWLNDGNIGKHYLVPE